MESREIEKSRIVVAKAKKSASGVGDPLARWRKKEKMKFGVAIVTSSFFIIVVEYRIIKNNAKQVDI